MRNAKQGKTVTADGREKDDDDGDGSYCHAVNSKLTPAAVGDSDSVDGVVDGGVDGGVLVPVVAEGMQKSHQNVGHYGKSCDIFIMSLLFVILLYTCG